ncbi:MAG TPA: restriction endonuclease subunit S [Solirubrobacterales bacterium]|nr:restriction endonuclease subunit S [Solirubrobacterales bacterium]
MSVVALPQTTKVGEICELRYGKSLPKSKRRQGRVPVFGSNGIVGMHDAALSTGKTIVIGRKGSIGEIHLSDEACWPIDTTYYIDDASTDADVGWLAYALKRLHLKDLNRAAAVPGLNREDVYRLQIVVPSSDEQLRIAKVLDFAQSLIDAQRETVSLFDELLQSIFVETFGDPLSNANDWPIGTIGELLAAADYGTSKSAGQEGALPVLRMGNLTAQGRVDMTDLKYMDITADEISRYTVQAGDVLFNRTNSPKLVGKTAIYEGSTPVAYAGYLIRLRVKPPHRAEYLKGFLNTAYSKQTLREMCKSIVGMANINATELQEMSIPVPPPHLQLQYAKRVASAERQRQLRLDQLKRLETLSSSLQSRVFGGEF